MTVVSSKEFVSNEDKYFDLAMNEQVFVQKGDNMFLLVYSSLDKTTNPNDEVNNKKLNVRHGWAEAAKEFVETDNEETFFPDFFKDEDLSWWQWEQK